jgi:hypothetical protein
MAVDMEDRVRREVRKFAVQRQIQCPVNGRILDVRTAVHITSANDGRTLAIVSPEGWRTRRHELTAMHNSGRVLMVVDNAPKNAPFEPAAPKAEPSES